MTTTIDRTHQIAAVRQYSYPCSERTHALIGSRLPAGRKPTNPELVALLTQLLDEQLNPGMAIAAAPATNGQATVAAARTISRQRVYDAYRAGIDMHGWCGVATRCLSDMGIDVYADVDSDGQVRGGGELSTERVRKIAMRYARDNSQTTNVRALLLDHLGIDARHAY